MPEDLERVVLRYLAKDPAERFPDAESLEGALAACSCAGEWSRDRAARCWHDASPSAATPGIHGFAAARRPIVGLIVRADRR
jgi:eukaryotic-like serine/threonine-protein kinase